MKRTTIYILAIVVCGLTLSGCMNKQDSTSEQPSSKVSPANYTATADVILAQENIGITDSEIQDLDQQMTELEKLIADMEQEGNFTIEEI